MSKNILINNNLSEIEKLSKAVAEFGKINNLSSEVIYDVRLTLEEVVSNIIKYGFEDNYEATRNVRNAVYFPLRGNRLMGWMEYYRRKCFEPRYLEF